MEGGGDGYLIVFYFDQSKYNHVYFLGSFPGAAFLPWKVFKSIHPEGHAGLCIQNTLLLFLWFLSPSCFWILTEPGSTKRAHAFCIFEGSSTSGLQCTNLIVETLSRHLWCDTSFTMCTHNVIYLLHSVIHVHLISWISIMENHGLNDGYIII